MTTDRSFLKQQAAHRAVEHVKSGMVLGLGSGSTATLAIRRTGQLLAQGALRNLVGVPTSQAIADEAVRAGIPLTTLEAHPVVDLTIDGADEVDPALNLIKGGGGALLREKIVAQASRAEIIIVDESKLSPALGINWPVPIEVVPFGWSVLIPFLEALGGNPSLRLAADDAPFLTDQGNYILDCHFGQIGDPVRLAEQLKQRIGVVEHGLFIELASSAVVAGVDGVRELVSGM